MRPRKKAGFTVEVTSNHSGLWAASLTPTALPQASSQSSPRRAGDPAGKTKELTPSDRDATQASSDRLKDLPEWLEEFTEHFGGSPINILWKCQRRSSRTTSDPLSSNKSKGTHHFSNFPKDPNCEIRKRTEITRVPCRLNFKSHISGATKFGDIITADHKILNEEVESRNSQRYAFVVQVLALNGIKVTHARTKTSHETARNLRQFLDP